MESPRSPEDTDTARPDDLVIVPESVELIDERGDRRPATPHPSPEQRQQRRIRQVRSRPKVALALFVATCLSTFFAGAVTLAGPEATLLDHALSGLMYSAAVMGILLAHEMGHYLQARRYHVPASLPYFLPMPLTPLGTLGAVIFQGGGVADRKQTFDIAISGPIAGLVVALPIAWLGIQQAEIEERFYGPGVIEYGDPLLLQWMIAWVRRPLAENEVVLLNPLLFAGWVGIFVTALNLVPIGQLDGGHMLYTLIGRWAHAVALVLIVGAMAWMLWTGNFAYILIVLLLLVFGPRHPPTADDTVPIGWWRHALGWATLAFIFIGFTPQPIVMPEKPETEQESREELTESERRPQLSSTLTP